MVLYKRLFILAAAAICYNGLIAQTLPVARNIQAAYKKGTRQLTAVQVRTTGKTARPTN